MKVFYNSRLAAPFFIRFKGRLYGRAKQGDKIYFSHSKEHMLIKINGKLFYEWVFKHELQHIYQQRREGSLKFRCKYVTEYLINLIKLRNHNKAYEAISYEVQARAMESVELTNNELSMLGIE